MSSGEWSDMLMRREEIEYDLPEEEARGEHYVAADINRFRQSWYFVHLFASFHRVTETTTCTHTFLKTPGAFSLARAAHDLTPDVLKDLMLKKEKEGGHVSMQSIFSDKSVPNEVKKGLSAFSQSTAGLVGSNGHRRLCQHEGVAYTLAFGPPLVFVTPNLADTRQPLLLVVQNHEFRFEDDLPSYREMSERLAKDPAGQAIVFEVMISLLARVGRSP